jgi:galactokinase
VNLIGEHTDYNDGFVLPMAIPADTAMAVSVAPDGDRSELWSEGFGSIEIDDRDAAQIDPEEWAAHVRGVNALLSEHAVIAPRWRGTIATDIPVGASLSSSAALEVATAMAVLELAGESWTPLQVAKLGQRVENDVLGLPSGIMDQLVSAAAVAGHALLIDCRSLDVQPVALPPGVAVAIMDTGTRRKLTESAFADRRDTCMRAAGLLGVDSLRDVSLDDLKRLGDVDAALEQRRARHVVTENQRTVDAAAAMASGNPAALGSLMQASHQSLRDDYEVTGPALDRIVDAAAAAPGCLGARMTGGGFAGCAVALVESGRVDDFRAATASKYELAEDRSEADAPIAIWLCEPGPGASIVRT